MRIGVVDGAVWATKKCSALSGFALLVVKTGTEQIVAADLVGAGKGDTVLILRGSSAQHLTNAPIDTAIIAILDQMEAPHVNQ